MSDTGSARAAVFRSRPVMLAIVVALVIVLIWVVAFYVPQGHKLTQLDQQKTSLEAQQAQLEAKVAQLKRISNAKPQLLALEAKYRDLIPDSADTFPYVTTLQDAATQTGVTISNVSPASSGTPITGTSVEAIPFSVSADGTYDQTLAFIKALYALPRLTVVDAVSISGGGPSTNRGTVLSVSYSLTIFSTATPSTASG